MGNEHDLTQRDVLADLLVALDGELVPDANGAQTKPPVDLPPSSHSGPSNGVGRTQSVVNALQKRPGMPIAELAREVYGKNDDVAQSNVRSLLASLKKQERIHSVGPGRWITGPNGGHERPLP